MPKPPVAGSPFWRVVRFVGRLHVIAFRLSRGRVGGSAGRAGILLLNHVGRRTGKERVTPLLFVADGPNLVLVASKGGTDTHPAWYHNLLATPEAEVEMRGGERRRVRARVADMEERARPWPRMVEVYKNYETYQTSTARQIPVVVLEPA